MKFIIAGTISIAVCSCSLYYFYWLHSQPKMIIKVPNVSVGKVIGRHGHRIRELEKQTRTKIRINDENPNQNFRVCEVTGDEENCYEAKAIIENLIDGEDDENIELKEILIPSMTVKKVIGKSGANIKSICQQSGAKCNFSKIDHAYKRKVLIKGTKEQIKLADELIMEIVTKDVRENEKRFKKLAETMAENKYSWKTIAYKMKHEMIEKYMIEKQTIDVYVSALVDPDHFYIQIVKENDNLNKLIEEMTHFYSYEENRTALIPPVKPVVGDIFAARFMEENEWFRTEVVECKTIDDTVYVKLFYLDFGDYYDVPATSVYIILPDFMELHFQAIKCYLTGVKPIEDEWSVLASDIFEEITDVARNKKIQAKIIDWKIENIELPPIAGVQLMCNETNEEIDLATKLVKDCLATVVTSKQAPPSSSS